MQWETVNSTFTFELWTNEMSPPQQVTQNGVKKGKF